MAHVRPSVPHGSKHTQPSRLSLCMTSLSRLPLHTPHSCRHHCDQSVSVPSCLLSGSAWLQTTLVFLVWAQTSIWAIPLVVCEGGCSLRVGIYQMLLPLWETIINLGSAGNGFPPIAAHICSNTLSPLVDRSITFKQLKNSDIRRKSCFLLFFSHHCCSVLDSWISQNIYHVYRSANQLEFQKFGVSKVFNNWIPLFSKDALN